MRALKVITIFILAASVSVAVMVASWLVIRVETTDSAQEQLQPFYTPPDPLPAEKPGHIIRSELMSNVSLKDATAHRVLYLSQDIQGKPVAASAMIFMPAATTRATDRKIVAWAHPTVGMADKCAPSRTADPLQTLPWVQQMMDLGWIVTATDYAGLGTPGIQYYLVGRSEAQDVINSVRMAREFPDAQAGSEYAVYGHSQGGHAALWAGELSRSYAPELRLVGVAGAAPAAEFASLVDQQWQSQVGWVIGAEVMISWPEAYPDVSVQQVISPAATGNYVQIAEDCMIQAGVAGIAEKLTGHRVFRINPATSPPWKRVIEEQTPKPLPKDLPVLVAQSVNDGVVIPNTTSLLQRQWCAAGSSLTVDWLGPLSQMRLQTHAVTGAVAGPLVANWFQDRFAGLPANGSCTQTPPIAPYSGNQVSGSSMGPVFATGK